MKKIIALAFGLTVIGAIQAFADPLTWDTPIGKINLNVQTTEALVGYDGIVKQAVAGLSLPVWTDPKQFVALQVGAVAPWQSNGPTIEPYVAAGHDIAREIPGLNQYKSLHLNVFGRWVSSQGKAGAGISASYSFGQ